MFSILGARRGSNIKNGSLVENEKHFIFGKPLKGPFSEGTRKIMLGMGCFWGVEKIFWNMPGVEMTAVGYSGGTTVDPTYENVCSSKTGHNEVLLLHYNPKMLPMANILRAFWEGHNPTQGMRQGNDIGSQYRSGIYFYDIDDYEKAIQTRLDYSKALHSAGFGSITTEIVAASTFYYAELYHQQYLGKNPTGYCGIGGTGVQL